jgi:hypothetical protein
MSNDKPTSWRDIVKIHPAADLFPLMTADELKALGEDVAKNGLRVPIVLWSKTEYGAPVLLLDGRNRLDAAELAGVKVFEVRNDKGNRIDLCIPHKDLYGSGGVDPYEFVLSANIHRRHLSADDKRKLIAKLLKATPEKSNRLIGEQLKVDNKKVASVRAEQEQLGEIPQLTKTVGKDGKARKQPAKKKRRTADGFIAEKEAREKAQAQAIADRAEERSQQTQHVAEQMQKAAQAVLVPKQSEQEVVAGAVVSKPLNGSAGVALGSHGEGAGAYRRLLAAWARTSDADRKRFEIHQRETRRHHRARRARAAERAGRR